MSKTPLQTEIIPVPIPDLPDALDGVRLAVFADLHMDGIKPGPQHIEALRAAADARPDLICVLGDVIDNNTQQVEPLEPYLRQLGALAPTVAVLGNNDCWSLENLKTLRAVYERCGIVLLENEARTLSLRGGALEITGLLDPAGDQPRLRRPRTEREKNAPRLTLAQSVAPRPQEASLSLLLVHRPELAASYAAMRPGLILAGHAHGGQIRLPLLGGLYAPGQGPLPRLTSGLYPLGESRLLVSRGLGNHGCSLRFGNPFHLPIAELRKK